MPASIAVDVGGTFTDLIYRDEPTGRVVLAKEPTTPATPDEAVLAVLDSALDRRELAGADYFLHGTTVGLNALLEGRGAVVGLLATRGFRDVLEIRRGDRDDPYDLFWRPPAPIVPRHLRLPVTGRIRADGTEHEPLDPNDVNDAVATFRHAGVTAIAVAFINAYANPEHELEAERLLRAAGFDGHISLSHAVSGEYREYERTCTAVIDAFVRGRMNSYLSRVQVGLRERGFAGECLIMRSGGGAMTFEEATNRSVETILSGPVAGARAVAELAREFELEHAVAADVGGTSFDTCLIDHGRPPVLYQGSVVGLPLQAPWIDVRSIGAGGGSIAHVDAGGLLRVGPQSAGAEPGPACYGRGGADPTVTDAAVVLGMLPASRISGGVELSSELAEQALGELAAQLEFRSAREAARGVMRVVAAQMGDAIRSVTIERGRDPRDASLVAFGGAGPLFATLLADELSVRSVIVPAYAGNFSAWGLLRAELTRTVSRTYLTALSDASLRGAGELAEALFAQIGDHAANGRAARAVQLDMRFAGQEHTLTVPSPMQEGSVRDDSGALAETFLGEYARVFGSTIDEALEIVCVRAVLTAGHPNGGARSAVPSSNSKAGPRRAPTHEAWSFTQDRPLRFKLLDRAALVPGSPLPGPAIIREQTATTYVDAGFVVTVHDTGTLILTRGAGS